MSSHSRRGNLALCGDVERAACSKVRSNSRQHASDLELTAAKWKPLTRM